MKALTYYRYGSPDVLQIEELPKPVPTADQILIKVQAVSLNGSDKENLIGKPFYTRFAGLRKPSNPILGSDIAGTVESVGTNVTAFKPGDELFGEIPGYHGGLAEYVCTDGQTLAHKPAGLTFAEAAAIPQAAIIAWRGIEQKGQVQSGQQVLINGAGGSAGSFAIQLAKHKGAEVTAVDNGGKLNFMRALGADHVLDYTKVNFTKTGKQYDLILDVIGYRSAFAYRRALKPNGTYYFTGGSFATLLQTLLLGPLLKGRANKKVTFLAVPQNREDLLAVTELCVASKIRPIIDRRYALDEAAEAFRYLAAGHGYGKVIIDVAES